MYKMWLIKLNLPNANYHWLIHNLLILVTASCNGGSHAKIGSCCTANNPCEVNQGDCDIDEDCKGNLICGSDNCGPSFTWSYTDCCKLKDGKQILTNINRNQFILLMLALLTMKEEQ